MSNTESKPIGKILVGTAADDESGASELAAQLAATHGAELVVLRLEPLVDARRMFDPDGVPATSRPDVGAGNPHLRVRTSEAQGHPVRAVCRAAAAERPDLIVVGHGGSRRRPALMSRRDSRSLVERAPCAVLLVAS